MSRSWRKNCVKVASTRYCLVRAVPEKGRTLRGSGGLGGGYVLADDGGYAVAALGDAVEGVGGLHRAALMGDDDELGTLPQLLEDQEQPLQVRVVQGRFHLVEHV